MIGEYVKRPNKAWTAANANPVAVQAELCAFASWSATERGRHPAMLENAALWIAEEAAYFGIPITRLSPSQVRAAAAAFANTTTSVRGAVVIGIAAAGSRSITFSSSPGRAGEVRKKWVIRIGGGIGSVATRRVARGRPPRRRPRQDSRMGLGWRAELEGVGQGWGMMSAERDWVDWRLAGAVDSSRPDDVPDKIPDRWWPDNEYVTDRLR